jgi:phage terminase large subunit-like protein
MPQSKKPSKVSEGIVAWVHKFVHVPEGADVGKELRLRPWQIAEIEKIYDNPDGTRRAIISFGRKNAKTTLAAVLLLIHLCGPLAKRNRNAQLYSAAQSRDQAAILFSLAAKIVRMSPALNAAVKVRDSTKTLLCEHYGTTYRALSAEAATAYGLSPAFIFN